MDGLLMYQAEHQVLRFVIQRLESHSTQEQDNIRISPVQVAQGLKFRHVTGEASSGF